MTTTVKIIVAAFISSLGAVYLQGSTSLKDIDAAHASSSSAAAMRIIPGEVVAARSADSLR